MTELKKDAASTENPSAAIPEQTTVPDQAVVPQDAIHALDIEAQRLITDMAAKENLGQEEIAASVRNTSRSSDTINQLIKSIKKI